MRVETDRLLITEFTESMAESVHINSLDSDNRRFMPDEVFETAADALETVRYLISRRASETSPLVYPVLLKNGVHIGHVEACATGESGGEWEIGFHIGINYTSNGYAAEAVSAFAPYITERLGLSSLFGNLP
jgi:Acetyltransferases, including N-acetylases of ribosomal proteins